MLESLSYEIVLMERSVQDTSELVIQLRRKVSGALDNAHGSNGIPVAEFIIECEPGSTMSTLATNAFEECTSHISGNTFE